MLFLTFFINSLSDRNTFFSFSVSSLNSSCRWPTVVRSALFFLHNLYPTNAAITKNMALNPLTNNAKPNVDNPDEPPLSDDGGTGGDLKISNYE